MAEIKNINKAEIIKLCDQVQYHDGQVVSKTLAQNDAMSLTLLAFDQEKKIGGHETNGDALVTVLEGTGRVVIADKEHLLMSGESVVMPANAPYTIYSKERFKMLLVVVF